MSDRECRFKVRSRRVLSVGLLSLLSLGSRRWQSLDLTCDGCLVLVSRCPTSCQRHELGLSCTACCAVLCKTVSSDALSLLHISSLRSFSDRLHNLRLIVARSYTTTIELTIGDVLRTKLFDDPFNCIPGDITQETPTDPAPAQPRYAIRPQNLYIPAPDHPIRCP